MNQIEIKHVSFDYGTKSALTDIHLTIPAGLYGLLGPNGAGKTTLMKLMVGLLSLKQGEIIVAGTSVQDKVALRQKIGYLPQDFDFYPEMKVGEALNYLAVLDGMPADLRKKRISELLQLVNLSQQRNTKVKALSGGMKRRLGIAQCLLSNPPVLIVDEPTAGLDPEERIRFRNLLSDLGNDRVVVLSTHIASDIERTASQLAILHDGRVTYQGTVEQLLQQTRHFTYQVDIRRDEFFSFEKKYQIYEKQSLGEYYRVRFLHGGKPEIAFQPVEPSLEAAYLNVIQAESRQL